MEIKLGDKILMLGVGGIGMSALARYLRQKGCEVSGYDRTETPLTQELENEGISVVYELKEVELSDVDHIVYTPAVGENNSVLAAAREAEIPCFKRSVVLGEIAKHFRTIAIAGTHGKTTTASMVAYLLKTCGVDCNAFIGGVSVNFNSNYLAGKSEWLVVEADEYDRSFLTLFPELAAINSLDPDHLDIYGDEMLMRQTYFKFAQQVKNLIYLNANLKNEFPESLFPKFKTVGETQSDLVLENIQQNGVQSTFDLKYQGEWLKGVKLNMPGKHNVFNMATAIGLAMEAGVEPNQIIKAVPGYRGVKRRFEIHLNLPNVIFIDDYAHHPTEIDAAIAAAKAIRPDWPLIVAFQPHLFTRTRDFYQGFARSLSVADRAYLLHIYPARELSIDGVTSEMIIKEMTLENKQLINLKQLSQAIIQDVTKPAIFLTVGAGDIDTEIDNVKAALIQLNDRLK